MASGTSALEAEFQSPLGEGALLFRRMTCQEQLGRLPTYHIELLRPNVAKDGKPTNDAIAANRLLGQKATVKLLLAKGKYRYFNGWVTRFERGGVIGRFDVYRIEMRPWLWYLTLGQDSRIFQDKTAMEIIQAVFAEYGQQQIDNKVSGSLHTRPYCVQYRESDFAFVSRLMEEEGLYYYVSHTDGNHSLVICNGPAGHSAIAGDSLSWFALQSDDRYRDDVMLDWSQSDTMGSVKFVHRDYDYIEPAPERMSEASRTSPVSLQGDGEVFDFPGIHSDPGAPNAAVGKSRAELNVDIYESGHIIGHGVSRYRSTAVGSTFTFKDYPSKGTNTKWLITRAQYEMEFGEYEAEDQETSEGFTCRFEAVPESIRFQPEPITPRPLVRGPQTAVVVGPSGDEIHTEVHGRVKVQFRWDRAGKTNETSSCWVRVATPWASKGYGMISLPRMGDEVVVSFLEGDPDRPLITGSVYNGDNKSAYELPAHATVSGIRSRSSKGGSAANFNELRFEDDKGKEYVWLHAEKDFHRMVENDAHETIGNELWKEVIKHAHHMVKENADLTVLKEAILKIGADMHADFGADLNIAVKGVASAEVKQALAVKAANFLMTTSQSIDLNATQNIHAQASSKLHLKATAGVVIDGGAQLTIKGGSGFVVLDASGVTISGPMVKINSGGSASPADPAAKAAPNPPKAPPDMKANVDPLA